MMVTRDNHSWRYGIMVARIQLPYGQGMWPAFWMLNIVDDWPASGEIDIMEMVGGTGGDNSDYRSYASIHWADNSDEHQSLTSYYEHTQRLADDWHYYELEWTETYIDIYFDDNLYFHRNISDTQYSEFRDEFFILLNVAVGGFWGGYPDNSTVFPQYMYVDWVRVYQPD
jgi:beta-glucanase (GH16 family)